MLFNIFLSYLAILYAFLLVYTTGESQIIVCFFLVLITLQMCLCLGQIPLPLLLLLSLNLIAIYLLSDTMCLSCLHAHIYFLLWCMLFHLSPVLNIKTVICFCSLNPLWFSFVYQSYKFISLTKLHGLLT